LKQRPVIHSAAFVKAAALSAVAIYGSASAITDASAQTRSPQEACSRLANLFVPAWAIGLPTSGAVVQSATFVTAEAPNNQNGEYCAVKGLIVPASADAPNMEFQVNLPTSWNSKALQLGGGGYDGTLVTGLGMAGLQPASIPTPLKAGYVTLGSDGGHKGAPGFDGTFGMNDEALLNFGKQSVKKTHDVAMAIVKARYGTAPRRFYYIGNSQGGHEALDAAARYSADYDGVVANYPAYNVTMLHLGSLNVGKALYGNGGAGWINPAKTRLLTDAVHKACDGLDSAQDGIIGNIAGCNAAFNIETVKSTLRCANGTDTGDTCLSDAQIAAVEKIASPYRPGFAIAGMEEFPRWSLLEGARFEGRSTFGTRPVPGNPPTSADALLHNAGAATTKYILTRNPSFDALTFEPTALKERTQESGTIMDVTDVDLTPFRAKGGKIILLHGTTDDFITPHNTVAYYNRHKALQGEANMDSFVRFYVVPGLSHGFGAFNAKYDGLAALDSWVENGNAPGTLVAVDGNQGASRTRPMCLYPAWPRYNGTGSVDDAANFSCVTQ
jgi:pimeloyl-ACP methyl ester carboxylesterase